jgi:crotonobetainyl-CoA:carnitine CoA-transferase CaiB-like acyl-CoA transferase
VVILDTTQNLSGPFGTMLLGDLGAAVSKVERQCDRVRHLHYGSKYFDAVNRNNRRISVDLSRLAGQRLLDTPLAEADVFVENMSTSGAENPA